MELGIWVGSYCVSLIFWLWIIKWGGSECLVGWKAWGILGWFTGHWNSKQLELYALVLLIFETIWFVVGLVSPDARAITWS